MAKEIKQYRCEACGALYDDERCAVECERYHVHVRAIDTENYDPCRKLPNSVYLRMSDGSLIKYNMDEAYQHLMRVGNMWGRKG